MATSPHTPSLIPVHVGLAEPKPPDDQADPPPAPRRSPIGRNRRDSPLMDPALGWAEHGLEPRWLRMESSDCAAALDPSIYHDRGADELERFLAGARERDELALLITTMGNVNDDRPRPLGATADATISLPGVETYISGARLPASATISLADGLDAADRDLGLRLRNGRGPDAPWWSLQLTGSESWPGTGGPPTRYEPTGELQPILLDGLNQPVVAVWSSAEGDQRWYVVPDVCDWDSILDWLVQRALARYVPGALRRARSPLALDLALQSPAEVAARQALEELETSFTQQRRELEVRLEEARAHMEPIRNGLLYGTGAELENTVATVLEAAGLDVVKIDELLGETSSADLLVSLGERRRLIEVKSASGNAAETLVGQLETHLRTWPQLRPADPVDGGVLVVNHQHRTEPGERSAAVYTRPELIAALTVPVLSTRQLFDWWRASEWASIRQTVLGDTDIAAETDDTKSSPSPPSANAPTENPEPGPLRRRFRRRPRSETE